MVKMNKTLRNFLIIFAIIILLGTIIGGAYFFTRQTGLQEQGKSDISCNEVIDCENYLKEQGAPEDFLNSIILTCEDKLCSAENK